MASRAGLLVRRGEQLAFLSAGVAKCVLSSPRLTRLPWDTAQMALVGGNVVAVLELSEPTGVLVLCELDGQPLALSGLVPERAGFWPASADGALAIEVDGCTVPALDLPRELSQFRGKADSA